MANIIDIKSIEIKFLPFTFALPQRQIENIANELVKKKHLTIQSTLCNLHLNSEGPKTILFYQRPSIVQS